MNKYFWMLMLSSSAAFATQNDKKSLEEEVAVLDTISVQSTSLSKSAIHAEQINKGLVWDERDLVKNHPGITVVEGGRAGNNGYAMRGVDGDRIFMSVDGMNASESYMPRFYYIKGFHNGNRSSTEIENLGSMDIVKGADAVSHGSGSVGGSVVMRTKDVHDFVEPGKSFGLYSKSAYSSKNQEFRQVLGMGFVKNGWEGLVQYTRRDAKELDNWYSGKLKDVAHCGALPDGNSNYSFIDTRERYPDLCGRGRLLPDDVDYKSQSWLAKLGYRFNDRHFLNVFYEDLRQDRTIEEKSFYLLNRHVFSDITPYQRYGVQYEYTPESEWLRKFSMQYAEQKVRQSSRSDQYGTSVWKNYAPDYQLVTKARHYQTEQIRKQLDLSADLYEKEILGLSHTFSVGLGGHLGDFSNKNKEVNYSAYSNKTTIKDFAIQQPVRTQSYYVYLKDQIAINDRLNVNLGVRYDNYRYSPSVGSLPYENAKKNDIVTALPKRKMAAFSYSIGADYALTPNSTLSYAFSTGFKAPKIEEMYFDLKGPGVSQYIANTQLKAEKSFNHSLGFSSETDQYALNLSAFYSQYRDFIDLGVKPVVGSWTSWTGAQSYYLESVVYQAQNIAKARVMGLDFSAQIQGDLLGLPKGFYTNVRMSYAKGKKSDGTSLLAVQPFTAVLGVGYDAPDYSWGILLNGRYVADKKAKDAMTMTVANGLQLDVDRTTGEVKGFQSAQPHPFLSSSYFIVDFTGHVKLGKHVTLNAGVFNVFNRKYSTWDNLRQIKNNGAQGDIFDSGRGIGRYTSPGRNYAVSIEARF